MRRWLSREKVTNVRPSCREGERQKVWECKRKENSHKPDDSNQEFTSLLGQEMPPWRGRCLSSRVRLELVLLPTGLDTQSPMGRSGCVLSPLIPRGCMDVVLSGTC